MNAHRYHIPLELRLVFCMFLKRGRTVGILLLEELVINLSCDSLFFLDLLVIEHCRPLNKILHDYLHQLSELLLIETDVDRIAGCNCDGCWSLSLLSHLDKQSDFCDFEELDVREDTRLAAIDIDTLDCYVYFFLTIDNFDGFVMKRLKFEVVVCSVTGLESSEIVGSLHLGVK